MDFTQEKQQAYFGLKVNLSMLQEKDWTIQQVVEALKITQCEHVIGYDHQLAQEQHPHYHIHWTDTRSLDALQKAKQKAMPKWGRTTKLYAAKDIPEGDVYCWYGYAVKEQQIYKSDSIDQVLLDQHAHTQAAVKRSRLNWEADQAIKKEKEKSLEEEIFETVKIDPQNSNVFRHIGVQIMETYLTLTDKYPRKSTVENLTLKYLRKFKIWNSEDGFNYYFPNY